VAISKFRHLILQSIKVKFELFNSLISCFKSLARTSTIASASTNQAGDGGALPYTT